MANAVLRNRKAYVITGPTSGIGRATAFELAKHGMVVLVGRDNAKLDEVQKAIQKNGQQAIWSCAICQSQQAYGARLRTSSRSISRSLVCSITRASGR